MSTTTLERHSVRPATVLRVVPDVAEGRRPAGQVRLTRRGRFVVVAAALLLALGAGILFGAVSVATDAGGVDVATQVVVVSEGDTLWGIAAGVADDGEVRSVMADIERLNALDSKVLQLGQKLRIPISQ